MVTRFAPTVEEILDLPDDGYRHELVYGVHHVSPAPGGPHQSAAMKLAVRLVLSCPVDYQVLAAPFAWVITGTDGERHEVQPDLLVVSAEQARLARLEDELPALVIEVLSPGAANRARDLEEKFTLYQAVGVPAYWVLDPLAGVLSVWRLHADELVPVCDVGPGERFETDWPWSLTVRPDELI